MPARQAGPSRRSLLPNLRDKRRCTDAPWAALFLVFCVGWGGVSYTGIANQQYQRVTNGLDYSGNTCGVGACDKFPYRYFPVQRDPTFALCVDVCPTNSSSIISVCQANPDNYTVTPGGSSCQPDGRSIKNFRLGCKQVEERTRPHFSHFCIPTTASVSAGSSSPNSLARVVGGLENAWKSIGVSLIIAVLLSFAVLLIIRVCGGIFVFSLLLATFATLVWGGVLAGKKADDATLESDVRNTFKWASYGVYGLAFSFLVLALFLRHQIRLSIKVVKEGTHAVTDMKMLLVVPFLKWFLLTLLFVFFIGVAICLIASGALETLEGDAVSTTLRDVFGVERYDTFAVNNETRKLLLYHLFGLIWSANLIVFLGHMVVSVAVSFWYFHRHERGFHAADVAVGRGFRLAFREHFGSVAFGAAIIALVEWVRALLSCVRNQLKKTNNRVAKAILCSCACCMWAVDKCLKFVLGEAFILMALEGQSFCTSCKSAFALIYHNAASLGTLHMIGHLSVLFGKVFITAGTTILAYYLMTTSDVDHFATDEPLGPCIVVALLAYFVASTFMLVYGQTINTLLVCFITEESLTGSATLCSDTLHHFVKDARQSGIGQPGSGVAQQGEPAAGRQRLRRKANEDGTMGASLVTYEQASAANL